MNVVHLTSSRFVGGPERQIVELAKSLPAHCRSVIASFSEGGLCRALLDFAREGGIEAIELQHDTPRLFASLRDLIRLLKDQQADVVCCQGYKANLLGLLAARRLHLPVVSVSRGWTGESFRVRMYEAMDRHLLRLMDRVVCVSHGQAEKVLRCGVAPEKCRVIHNAIRTDRFDEPRPEYRGRLQDLFPARRRLIVGAAGRLSPEKGFEVLIDAATDVIKEEPEVGFVLFGDGALRESLANRIRQRGLEGPFVLAGFRSDLDYYLPHLDLLTLPSFTEGLPNVVLEAFAGGVPVVATAVGGVPEVVEHGVNGYCVAPGKPGELAGGILDLLADDNLRRKMGDKGRERVVREMTFDVQAQQYQQLFENLVTPCPN